MKKPLAIITLIAVMALLSACNTVRGIGADMKQAGEKIEDAARKK
jgi:predicted small secreted protein